jgi:hypothetical protein
MKAVKSPNDYRHMSCLEWHANHERSHLKHIGRLVEAMHAKPPGGA